MARTTLCCFLAAAAIANAYSLLGAWDAIGIDFSTVGVARARRMLGPLAEKVCEGDFFTYPLGERCFDMIYERTVARFRLTESYL
jgi:hypothetical protein